MRLPLRRLLFVAAAAASLALAGGCTDTGGASPTSGADLSSRAGVATTAPTPTAAPDPSAGTAATGPAATGSKAVASTTRSTAPTVLTAKLVVSEPVSLPESVGPEASGLAPSSTIPGAFWTVGDETGDDTIVAVDLAGKVRASVQVTGMSADNAEAIAVAPCDLGRCLFVGDIGDNASQRDHVTVYRLVEPTAGKSTAEAEQWDYRYPDGPHNAESLIVTDDAVLIVTKPDGGVEDHHLYRGPLGGGDLDRVGDFRPPKPKNPMQSLVTGVVATDASWDGRRVLLLTYDEVIAYRAPSADADPTDFPSWKHQQLPIPALDQAEGVASLDDGCGYAVSSEAGPVGSKSAIASVRCP